MERSPGFERNLAEASKVVERFNAEMPEDRLEPTAPVLFTCPLCGCEQDPARCERCADYLCERCDPEHDAHVRCLPPERMTPYLLLQDCQLTLLRVKKALRECNPARAARIADNMERVLSARSIR